MSWDKDTGNRPLPGTDATYSDETHLDIATVAYETSTGERRWVARYNGPENLADSGNAIRVSPDGERVYVTGVRDSGGIVFSTLYADYVTLAYDSEDGALLWSRGFDGPTGHDDWALTLDVGAGVGEQDDRVYVSGAVRTGQSPNDYKFDIQTLAYDGTTGALEWQARYSGSTIGYHYPFDMAISPDGNKVYVAGTTQVDPGSVSQSNRDLLILALDAGLGEGSGGLPGGTHLWTYTYDGPEAGPDGAFSLRAAPDGASLFATGISWSVDEVRENYDAVTLSVDSASGDGTWTQRFAGRAGTEDTGWALAVAPDGNQVYVTGKTALQTTKFAYNTTAYDAHTGAQVWRTTYDGVSPVGAEYPAAIATSPDGQRIYVSGASAGVQSAHGPPWTWEQADSATLAYDMSGNLVWTARHNTSIAGIDSYSEPELWRIPWASLVVDPESGNLYMARTFAYQVNPTEADPLTGAHNQYDYGILGYAP